MEVSGNVRRVELIRITFLPDDLSVEASPGECIIDIARGKKPEDLSPEDIEQFRELYPDAVAKWETVSAKRFDDKFFGFDQTKLGLMQKYIALESFALDQLGYALEGNDNQNTLQAAIGLKPNFAKLYKLFGDFSDFD